MADLTLPFGKKLKYWDESSLGTPTGSPLAISSNILDARISLADKHTTEKSIDKITADMVTLASEYTFHLEYIPQSDDTLLAKVLERGTCDDLPSQSFELCVNASCPTAERKYYLLKGCKAKTVRISASVKNRYTVAIDFIVKEVSTATTSAGSDPTALTGDLLAFNVAGSIKDGSNNPLAYILNSIDITVEHNTKSYLDHDSMTVDYIVAGDLDITGSVDISLDDGGTAKLSEVLAQDDFDIVINMGSSGAPIITLKDCRWKTFEIDANVDGDIAMMSAPFTATNISVS